MSHRLSSDDSFSLAVGALARVEGEGALDVTVQDGRVVDARLSIYEPPRFFEALLRGRGYREPADITARICGICPVAYQMSAVHAVEAACGVRVTGPIRELRRLIYCGEWIESHTLHVAMLHAPDFLGYAGAVEMAADHPQLVELALRLKKAGNAIVELVGGRPVHPVNIQVGGFYRVPTRAELHTLVAPLEQARDDAQVLLRTVSGFDFPDAEEDYDFVALRASEADGQPAEYPFNEGRIVSTSGRSFPVADFERHVVETHEPHSTALHGHWRDGGSYLVGPLARYALNADRLPPPVRAAAAEAGLAPVCRNMFASIVVRAVEILYACEEALRIVAGYEPPDHPHVEVEPRAGEGHGCTEAPRGILYHRYRLEADGTIADARIVPPTAQNQPAIEADLRRLVQRNLDLPHEVLRARCEQAIRNYDPCISCATHFLDLRVTDRSGAAP